MITLASSRSFALAVNGNRAASMAIRAIPGAQWDAKKSVWKVPVLCAQFVAEFSERHRIEIEAEARQVIERLHTNRMEGVPLPDLDAPLRNGRKLFEHQKTGVRFLVSRRRAILADDMGLGKSMQALVAAKCFDVPVHVICPASLRDNWQREAEGVGVRITTHSWAKVPKALPQPFVLIADECFPFDTTVMTEYGGMLIGRIVEHQIDVRVVSRDDSGNLTLRRISRYICKATPEKLYTVRHENGEFTCTGNHKIWTEEHGYIRAEDLTEATKNGDVHLLALRSELRGADGRERDVLLEDAREPAQCESATGIGPLRDDAESYREKRTAPRCSGADASQQSYVEPGRAGENAREHEGATIRESRRQRDAHQSTDGSCGAIGFADGILNPNQGGQRSVQQDPACVQDGPCAPGDENSDRGGREDAQTEKPAGAGSTQGVGTQRSRLVSVEILESRGRRESGLGLPADSRVYNLEIEIDHNYFAEGVLVSNCHYAQSGKKSQRGAAFLALSETADAAFLLTGTPMKNGRPVNLYPLLKAVRSPLALNKGWFEKRYCDAQPGAFTAWDTSGASNLDELGRRVAPVMLRRMKNECLDLPEKTRVMRDAEATAEAKRLYSETLNNAMVRYTEKIMRGEVSEESESLVRFGYMRMAGSVAKVQTTLDIAEEITEQGGSVVIFVAFLESARRIAAAFPGSCLLIGETPQDERQKLVDRFQAGGAKVFVTTFGAGGVGITLTRAQTVILHDRPWTPGDCYQAEDRIHRIGQHSNVLSIWLQWDDTDKAVDALLESKTERIEVVMAGRKHELRAGMSIKQFAEIAVRAK